MKHKHQRTTASLSQQLTQQSHQYAERALKSARLDSTTQ